MSLYTNLRAALLSVTACAVLSACAPTLASQSTAAPKKVAILIFDDFVQGR
jgi:hypothetical protein